MNNQITCSGALFYTLDTNRFLFLHRAQGKRANLWGLVGGTNEGAETPWEGLKREIQEEIGQLPVIKKHCRWRALFHPIVNSIFTHTFA